MPSRSRGSRGLWKGLLRRLACAMRGRHVIRPSTVPRDRPCLRSDLVGLGDVKILGITAHLEQTHWNSTRRPTNAGPPCTGFVDHFLRVSLSPSTTVLKGLRECCGVGFAVMPYHRTRQSPRNTLTEEFPHDKVSCRVPRSQYTGDIPQLRPIYPWGTSVEQPAFATGSEMAL